MAVKQVVYSISCPGVALCPKLKLPEYAFIGRSNVGKSSLINMLANKKNLAKTSSTPGKTRLINYFIVDGSWYLVDLPGYGYAKTSKVEKKQFSKIITGYISNRTELTCLFVLIDIRLEPQKIDLEFMEWLGTNQVPFVIVFTKSDKIGKDKIVQNIENYNHVMLKTWSTVPKYFITSAVNMAGKEEIISFIESVNKEV